MSNKVVKIFSGTPHSNWSDTRGSSWCQKACLPKCFISIWSSTESASTVFLFVRIMITHATRPPKCLPTCQVVPSLTPRGEDRTIWICPVVLLVSSRWRRARGDSVSIAVPRHLSPQQHPHYTMYGRGLGAWSDMIMPRTAVCRYLASLISFDGPGLVQPCGCGDQSVLLHSLCDSEFTVVIVWSKIRSIRM